MIAAAQDGLAIIQRPKKRWVSALLNRRRLGVRRYSVGLNFGVSHVKARKLQNGPITTSAQTGKGLGLRFSLSQNTSETDAGLGLQLRSFLDFVMMGSGVRDT